MVDNPVLDLVRLKHLRELQQREKAMYPTPALLDFASKCLIVEKEGTSESGLIEFHPWPEQEKALKVIADEPFLVMPKGRQVGATWTVLTVMLWAGSFWSHRLFNIARQSGTDAEGAITRLLILAGYDPNSEPPNMRVLPQSKMPSAWRPRVIGKTRTSLTFANGCHYQAKTASRAIGRGDAAYWALCDEYAFWPWPQRQLAALEHGAARVTIVSTGDGDDDAFARLYKAAVKGEGKWRAHFISAEADPRRDAAWFAANIDAAPDPDLARRELARDVVDVFRPREGAFFTAFSRSRNVREFDVVRSWRTEIGVDFGLAHPAAVFLQISPTGQPFVFDEYLPEDVRTSDFGAGIMDRLARYRFDGQVAGPFADPSGKSRNMQTKIADFEVLRGLGLNPVGQTSKVKDGVVLMCESIGDPDEDRRLIIHPRCAGLITALSNVEKHRNDEDIYDTDGPYSHVLDALRYWHVCRYRGHTAPGIGSVVSGMHGERPAEF